MIIYLLATIVLVILVWTIIVHYPKKQKQVLFYYTGISKTAYPDARPSFNVWMRYIKLKNHKNYKSL